MSEARQSERPEEGENHSGLRSEHRSHGSGTFYADSIITSGEAKGTGNIPVPRFLLKYADERAWVALRVWQPDPNIPKLQKKPVHMGSGQDLHWKSRATWSTLREVLDGIVQHDGDDWIVGVILQPEWNVVCIDHDECFDPVTGHFITDTAKRLNARLDCPVEPSVGGRGGHWWFKATFEEEMRARRPIELIYGKPDKVRVVALTGRVLEGTPDLDELPDRTDEVKEFVQSRTRRIRGEFGVSRYQSYLSDAEIIRRIEADSWASEQFHRLSDYNTGDGVDKSDLDFDLLLLIGDYTPDWMQCARIMSSTPLGQHGRWRENGDYAKTTLESLRDWKDESWAALVRQRQVSTSSRIRELHYLTLREALNVEPSEYLVAGYIPENALGLMYGESGTYKTFLALDMVFHVALGRDWHGWPVKQSSVVYMAAEGKGGFTKRLRAWIKHHRLSDEEIDDVGMRLLYETMNLVDPSQSAKFIDSLGTLPDPPKLMVIDTMSWVMPGEDENQKKSVTPVFEAARRIRELYGTTTVFIHHTGHDGKGPRGSYAFKGDPDFRFKVAPVKARGDGPNATRLKLIVEKQKDDEQLADQWFERIVVPLPEIRRVIRYGEIVSGSSCVVEAIETEVEAMIEDAIETNNDTERKILAALASFGEKGATATGLMKEAGFPNGSAWKVKDLLIEMGKILLEPLPPGKENKKGRKHYHPDFAPDAAINTAMLRSIIRSD